MKTFLTVVMTLSVVLAGVGVVGMAITRPRKHTPQTPVQAAVIPPMYVADDPPTGAADATGAELEALERGFGPALRKHSPATAIQIELRMPAETIIGEISDLAVVIHQGEPIDVRWSVSPSVVGFRINPLDPRHAALTSSRPGVYTVVVSVSGADGSVDHAVRQVRLHYPGIPVTAPPVALASVIGGYAAQVETTNRADEGLILSAVLRSRVAELRQGNNVNAVLGRMYEKAEESLGDSYPAWEPFLVSVVGLIEGYQAEGHLTSSASITSVLDTAARVLSGG